MSDTGPKSDEKTKDHETSATLSGEDGHSAEVVEVFDDVELTEADLDKLIEEENPDFLKKLSDIQKDKNIALNEASKAGEDEDLLEEIELWENSHGPRRKIYKVFPFAPHVSCWIKKILFQFNRPLQVVRVYLKNYIFFLRTQGKASFKAGLIGGIHALKGSITGQIKSFAGLGGLRKFSLILVLVGAVGTGLYIRRIVTKGFIHEDTSLFLPSLEPIASEIIDIEPDAKMEPFYDNLRAIQNLILLPKMMVNLKRQGSPMANPMAAFELFIEGDSPEVAIEAKDKEVSVRDAIQRVVEEFTFDTLDTPEGKRAMSERIKKEVAKMFSTGGVRRIYIKTLVLKP